MGSASFSCCFKNMRPNTITFTAIIANLVAVVFLIWGATDLYWKRKSNKALYLISFVFLCLILIAMIFILVLLNLSIDEHFTTINKIGKILCLIIIGLCILAFISLLIAEILILIDYNDIEKLYGPGRNISIPDWLAAILPGIIGLIASIIVILCVNVLYKIFNDNILNKKQNENTLNQNSITVNPNVQNKSVIISGNNSQPYNQPSPVLNSENGINIDNK